MKKQTILQNTNKKKHTVLQCCDSVILRRDTWLSGESELIRRHVVGFHDGKILATDGEIYEFRQIVKHLEP
jgi:hypothetical protein